MTARSLCLRFVVFPDSNLSVFLIETDDEKQNDEEMRRSRDAGNGVPASVVRGIASAAGQGDGAEPSRPHAMTKARPENHGAPLAGRASTARISHTTVKSTHPAGLRRRHRGA